MFGEPSIPVSFPSSSSSPSPLSFRIGLLNVGRQRFISDPDEFSFLFSSHDLVILTETKARSPD
jgi:hypothetical protein